ncbi:hypothetical protein GGI04_004300, partial [Coemansia thaxteri]
MSMHTIHYNCAKGWEFYPLVAIAGCFNAIICPAFVMMAWTYKDGYGIRNSLSIGS